MVQILNDMQLTTLSNPYASNAPNYKRRKFIKEEIELRDRPDSDISPWWKIITLLCYSTILTGGIVTSISVGSLLAAFQNNCVFYARLTLRGLEEIAAAGNRSLYDDNIIDEHYGSLNDCTFCEYCSAASAIFGGLLGIMFLQCGRGGVTGRSLSQSWIIVPPALVTDVVFFILSCIIFAKTIGGLTFFCNHLRTETSLGEPGNFTTCKEILGFHFPGDVYNTNLYLHYIVAQIGSFLTFFGWLMALFVLILRCFLPVDFVVYGRRLYQISSFHRDKRRSVFASNRSDAVDETYPVPEACLTTDEISDDCFDSPVATTSFTFTTVGNAARLKKST